MVQHPIRHVMQALVCAAPHGAHRLSAWAGLRHAQGTLRALAITVISACSSIADGGGWAGVEQAAQGRRGAELAAQE